MMMMMMMTTTQSVPFYLAVSIMTVYPVFLILYRLFLSPISNIPGPFLARISILWQLWHMWKHDYHVAIREAHRKYGHRSPSSNKQQTISRKEKTIANTLD